MGGISAYSIFLTALAFLLVGAFIVFVLRHKKEDPVKKIPDPVSCGSLSVLFDRQNNVVIIPYSKDKLGVGKAVGGPMFLRPPYNAVQLGQHIRDAMKSCENSPQCSDEELMSTLGTPIWKEFSEGKRNISIFYSQEHGIVFNTTRRRIDGSYQFNHFGFEKIIAEDSTDKEIGEVALALLPRCR